MSDWQPIETAPKDGSWFLAYSLRGQNGVRMSWGRGYHGDLGWCSKDYFWHQSTHNFTHWMSLPESPAMLSAVSSPSPVEPT